MSLEVEFAQAMENTGETAKEFGYVPNYFIRMLAEYGAVETARRLLANSDARTGLFKLWELGLLHESMEGLVVQERFKPLFTKEEIAEARRRLEELGYFK